MEARIFHADDWGMSRAINAGILRLAETGALRSASCLANGDFLEEGLGRLRELNVDIYLHFNLSHGRALAAPIAFPGHHRWMWRALKRQIDPGFVAAEFEAQLSRLKMAGAAVRGVNGHHHIHLLPGVSETVIVAARKHALPLLVLDDRSHLWSWLQTQWFLRRTQCAGVALERAAYLRARDLRSLARWRAKCGAARGRAMPLLVHPALWDDFKECGVTDKLREYRIWELNRVLGYLNA